MKKILILALFAALTSCKLTSSTKKVDQVTADVVVQFKNGDIDTISVTYKKDLYDSDSTIGLTKEGCVMIYSHYAYERIACDVRQYRMINVHEKLVSRNF